MTCGVGSTTDAFHAACRKAISQTSARSPRGMAKSSKSRSVAARSNFSESTTKNSSDGVMLALERRAARDLSPDCASAPSEKTPGLGKAFKRGFGPGAVVAKNRSCTEAAEPAAGGEVAAVGKAEEEAARIEVAGAGGVEHAHDLVGRDAM